MSDYTNYSSFHVRNKKRMERASLGKGQVKRYVERNYLPHLPEKKDAKILDIGCGGGGFLLQLKELGYEDGFGIDLDSTLVQHANEQGVRAIQQDAFVFLKETTESFDVIVLNDVIEHISADEAAPLLAACRERLTEGGKIILKTPNCVSAYGLATFFSDHTHLVGYTERRIEHVGLLAGFSDVESYNLFLVPGIPVIDQLYVGALRVQYAYRTFMHYLNARPNAKVFSKNFLAVLTLSRESA